MSTMQEKFEDMLSKMPADARSAIEATREFGEAVRAAAGQYGDLNAALRAGRINKMQHAAAVKELSRGFGVGVHEIDQFNRSLNMSNLSMRAVSESIMNAALKVGLWMIATTAVIGSIRKLQETVQIWRDLELSLERVGITTQTVGKQLSNYFIEASDVAIRMGMPIQQVMTGMNLALRATAGLEDQTKRAVTAQLMLRDAAILGNLAGMQFDQAINVLVGSLRQTGLELHEGISLLDRWVAVSRQAQVSINDLSQGFSVMAAAAESAGVNVDQINGLIAALSEAVTLGPVEIGNAIRALMSTLYNPESINLLQSFGIAARDVSGEFRSFWDIMNELAAMEMSGALNESQILAISRAAGAGQRRYAQFQAILKNWDIAVRVSTISAEAHGEALSANERIIDTLTNAWDQMSAAQSKMLYAMGDASGIISDLTDIMKLLARTFDWMSGRGEVVARLTKLVIGLTAAMITFKLALYGLARIKPFLLMMPGVQLLTGGIKALTAQTKLFARLSPALLGLRGPQVKSEYLMMPGFIPSKHVTPWGQARDPATGEFMAGTAVTTRGAETKAAWGAVGAQTKLAASSFVSAMFQPMRGMGLAFGGFAGGAIARELYKSNWSFIGGGIGAAIGGALMGPAGMAAGSLIGGFIAKQIEWAGKSAAEKTAIYMERAIDKMDPDIAAAIRGLQEDFDVTGLITEPFEEGATAVERMKDRLAEVTEEIVRLQDFLKWFEPDVVKDLSAIEMVGLGSMAYSAAYVPGHDEDHLESLLQKQRKLNRAIEVAKSHRKETLGHDYDIAAMAKKLIGELETQEAVERKINEIKARRLEMGSEQFEEELFHTRAADIAYRTLVSRLRYHTPDLEEVFRSLYPTFEDFVVLDPDSYTPLVEALSAASQSYIAMEEAQTKVNRAGLYLGAIIKDASGEYLSQENTLENMVEHYKFWARLQSGVLSDNADAWEELLSYADQLGTIGQDDNETRELSLGALGRMINLLKEGISAHQILSDEAKNYADILLTIEGRIGHIADFVTPGRLAFVGPDATTARIQEIIDRYTAMLEPYITSTPEDYHAFVRDEHGVLTGLLETFHTYPEVWAAMLQELNAIEKNTRDRLEAEYNIPGWYQTPTRYWAMKTTGMKEGFGPAQEGMWELWKEFLARQGADLDLDLEVDTEDATESVKDAIDEVCTAAIDGIKDVQEHIEGFDWSPWKFMEEAAKHMDFDDTDLEESIEEVSQEATRFSGILTTLTGIWNRFSSVISERTFLNLPQIEEDETIGDAIRRFVSGLFGSGSEIDDASKQASDSLGKLSREMDSTGSTVESASSSMSLSLRNTSGQLRSTTSDIYKFADALSGLGDSLGNGTGGGGGGGGGGGELLTMQQGGVVPATGPYYLHRHEVVSSVADIKNTNAILNGSYKVLLLSQSYLSSINLGISSLRQEISLLRQQMGHGSDSSGFTEFRRVTNTGYVGVSSLGTRRT